MYLNALEFLEEERELWRPFEALDGLTDEQLDTPDRRGPRLVRSRPHRAPRRLAGERPRGREGARGRRDVGDERAIRQGMGRARRRDQPRHPGRVAGAADRRGPTTPPRGPGRAPRLPDRRAGGALAQARRQPALLPRRDHRPLHRAPGRPRGDPRRLCLGGTGSGDPEGHPRRLTCGDRTRSRRWLDAGAPRRGAARRLPRRRPRRPARGRSWSRGEHGDRRRRALRGRDPPRRQIAAAAARTPDTAPSPRGPDWVRFNPRELDPHALDRLGAWLELAYRRAGE